MAAVSLPDLAVTPILDANGNPTLVVDTVSKPGKALLRFSLAIRNVGPGPFEVQATGAGDGTNAPAGQVLYDGATPGAPVSLAPFGLRNLTPAPFNPNSPGNWVLTSLWNIVLLP